MVRFHQINLVKEARPFIKELVDQCNETVHLVILYQEEVLYIAKEDHLYTIRMVSEVESG
jgi:DNA-binding IclR family transcriptional regulator